MSTERPSPIQVAADVRRSRATVEASWLIVSTAIERLNEAWEATASMVEATDSGPAWTAAAELLEEASLVLYGFPDRLAAMTSADDWTGRADPVEPDAEVVPIRPHVLTASEEAMAAAATRDDVLQVASDLTNEERSGIVRGALQALGVAQVPDVPEDSLPAFMRMLLRGREFDQ